MFWEPVYFKEDEHCPRPREKKGNWLGVSNNVGDLLTYLIYSQETGTIISRSDIRTADPYRGGIINR